MEEGQASSKDAAGETPVQSGESVAVTIYLTDNVDTVISFLEDNGGDPRNVGEDYIEAYVPVTLLGPVSEQPGVIRVREIIPPQPAYGDVTSQGVGAHLATAWHEAGITGQGVKVGIIDLGFEGFRDLMGTELPATIQARCYTDLARFTTNLADCTREGYGIHGTSVAETVVDAAPGVSLYIVDVRKASGSDVRSIVEWMISEGVAVINRSLSSRFDGPGDGTSPLPNSILNTVDRAVEGGIIWVSSAGNSAEETWFGPYENSDEDRWVDFNNSGDERNYLSFPAHDEIESFAIELRWEDSWSGAASDLDLFLFDGNSNEIVASVRDLQSGARGHYPLEYLELEAGPSPDPIEGRYYVAVSHELGDAPEWIQLRVRFFGKLQDPSGNRSIDNAAESANPGMLAVGATHYWDTHTIADYSSRGPTPDGRVKPDIVGTACGETASYEPYLRDGDQCWFDGTSQASPHIAGMAAPRAPAVPQLHPIPGRGLPEIPRAAARNPGPQQHLGARLRPTAIP